MLRQPSRVRSEEDAKAVEKDAQVLPSFLPLAPVCVCVHAVRACCGCMLCVCLVLLVQVLLLCPRSHCAARVRMCCE